MVSRLCKLLISLAFLLVLFRCECLEFRLASNDPICFVDDSNAENIFLRYNREKAEKSKTSVEAELKILGAENSVLYSESLQFGKNYVTVTKPKLSENEMYLICFQVKSKFYRVASENADVVGVKIYDDLAPPSSSIPNSSSTERTVVNNQMIYNYVDQYGQARSTLVDKEFLLEAETLLKRMDDSVGTISEELDNAGKRDVMLTLVYEQTLTRIWLCSFLMLGFILVSVSLEYYWMKKLIRKKNEL